MQISIDHIRPDVKKRLFNLPVDVLASIDGIVYHIQPFELHFNVSKGESENEDFRYNCGSSPLVESIEWRFEIGIWKKRSSQTIQMDPENQKGSSKRTFVKSTIYTDTYSLL